MVYLLILFGLGFVGWGTVGVIHGELDGIPIIVAGLLAFYIVFATRKPRGKLGE